MATFWEIAAHSVGLMILLYFDYVFVILVISRFCFKGWIWVLIASVLDLCIRFTSQINKQNHSIMLLKCMHGVIKYFILMGLSEDQNCRFSFQYHS